MYPTGKEVGRKQMVDCMGLSLTCNNAEAVELYNRVSNLKYGSVRIDSKTVVFIRANPGKKETTDGSSSHVIFFRDRCAFSEVVSCEKWHVTKNLGLR